MTKPNFFIVGIPRAGTTSMHDYLNMHPDIFMSADKEPHYFGSDLTRRKMMKYSDHQYLELFSKAEDEKIIGESSTVYIHSEHAADEIYKFNRNSKILISLRHPAEQVFSLYHKNYNPKNYSFEQVLEMEDIGDNSYIENGAWIKQAHQIKNAFIF